MAKAAGYRLTLRLPPEMQEWISRQAKQAHRTLNGEIVARLERTRWQDDLNSRPLGGGQPAAGQGSQA
jgi:hypothetical protein